MIRRPTISTRTYTLFPCTTLFRSIDHRPPACVVARRGGRRPREVRRERVIGIEPSAQIVTQILFGVGKLQVHAQYPHNVLAMTPCCTSLDPPKIVIARRNIRCPSLPGAYSGANSGDRKSTRLNSSN